MQAINKSRKSIFNQMELANHLIWNENLNKNL